MFEKTERHVCSMSHTHTQVRTHTDMVQRCSAPPPASLRNMVTVSPLPPRGAVVAVVVVVVVVMVVVVLVLVVVTLLVGA